MYTNVHNNTLRRVTMFATRYIPTRQIKASVWRHRIAKVADQIIKDMEEAS
jgi:hypothetical protein